MRLAVLCLLATGCAAPATWPTAYSVAVSDEFSAAESDSVLAGLSSWVSAEPRLSVSVHLGDCAGADVYISRGIGVNGTVMGATWQAQSPIPIIVWPDGVAEYGASLSTVAAHEFGHAMHLDHDPTPGTLMYWDALSDAPAPTDADLAAWGQFR